MFAEERRQAILAILAGKSRIEVAELAERFDVSVDTVRRDLRALASTGAFRKTHGGAVSMNVGSLDWSARAGIQHEAKDRIGKAAAQLVSPRQTVILDAGLTVLALAGHLDARPLTVITNSLDVATQFANDPGVSLIITGGNWDPTARYLSGVHALEMIKAHRADWVFLGTCALHVEAGMTAHHAPDAAMKRALLSAGLQSVLLADHTKFGAVAPHFVGSVDSVQTIVTDEKPHWLANAGPKIIVA
ncbi:MAG TPA: DeoR/GlpR family DNA-binding transcription regulator [Polyangiaceae bacterium]|jgi:DeoR/GlpR family transcriptional regulator of sugar metabolism|nr:DeoR/GlpR family DNA-binding transcription regulator [Polyangiaceae bacterium]